MSACSQSRRPAWLGCGQQLADRPVDNDAVAKLEQRLTALVGELNRQRERNRELSAENDDLRGRVEQARRRLDSLLEATADGG